MELRNLVEGRLRALGAEGLVNRQAGCCGCTVGDLMPCENPASVIGGCEPALERVCPGCGCSGLVICGQLDGSGWGTA